MRSILFKQPGRRDCAQAAPGLAQRAPGAGEGLAWPGWSQAASHRMNPPVMAWQAGNSGGNFVKLPDELTRRPGSPTESEASTMRLALKPSGARTSTRRQSRQLVIEPLEERTLLSGPPFSVGGDPIVNPSDFRVTTFASGLNYPHGMTRLSDGSLLVSVNNPVSGSSFYNTTGQLLRFTDANGDGVADGAGQVLYNGLPGGVTAVHQAGEFILTTSSAAGSERISVLRTGATPGTPLTLVGSINFSFP